MSNKTEAKAAEPHPLVGHVVPLKLMITIGATLIFFTWVTVAVTYIDLGRFNLWVALLIACVKAFLVALYFMHLRWDRPIHGFMFLTAIAFVTLFVGFTMMDTLTYQPDIMEAISSGG